MSFRRIEEGNQEPIFGRFLALFHPWWRLTGTAVSAHRARLANLTLTGQAAVCSYQAYWLAVGGAP